ncbi:MAG: site-specific DNA-methyltransferase [Phycisphaerales bacterium]
MRTLADGVVDLAFADPPFNIGYEYDEYNDKKGSDEYLEWSRRWMSEVKRVVKPDGAFWLAIGDEYAAELKVLATRELGFVCRSWVVWYYTFGVHCNSKFTRSHTHLFYFVQDPKKFTFNDSAVRVPSARQVVYADKRANPNGRVPDDTWLVRPSAHKSWILRPQDLPEGFLADSDTWYFPRVCGTFKERMGFHGCQMPEQLLGRIVRACSNEGDLVLDPFVGSGTTLAVAKKLGRTYLGFDTSQDYVAQSKKRLQRGKRGDPLDGSENPLASVARTPVPLLNSNSHVSSKGRMLEPKSRGSRRIARGQPAAGDRTHRAKRPTRRIRGIDEVSRNIVVAFQEVHNGLSTDRVLADPELNSQFLDACKMMSLPGSPAEWNRRLIGLRKAKALTHLRPMKPTRLPANELDLAEFGSEAAMAILEDRHGTTLDRILCDPILAEEFDKIAQRFAPNWSALHYRWGALRIRKAAHARNKAAAALDHRLTKVRFGRPREVDRGRPVHEVPAVYVLAESSGRPFYVGATSNLKERIAALPMDEVFEGCDAAAAPARPWQLKLPVNLQQVSPLLRAENQRYGFQTYKIKKLKPRLNCKELVSADS